MFNFFSPQDSCTVHKYTEDWPYVVLQFCYSASDFTLFNYFCTLKQWKKSLYKKTASTEEVLKEWGAFLFSSVSCQKSCTQVVLCGVSHRHNHNTVSVVDCICFLLPYCSTLHLDRSVFISQSASLWISFVQLLIILCSTSFSKAHNTCKKIWCPWEVGIL